MGMNERIARQYLEDYLREEFRNRSEVRIRVIFEDHLEGLSLKTESREYFFPFEWANGGFARVRAEVQRIWTGLGVSRA